MSGVIGSLRGHVEVNEVDPVRDVQVNPSLETSVAVGKVEPTPTR